MACRSTVPTMMMMVMAVIVIVTSSVGYSQPMNDEEPPAYNRTCFVPPSERPFDIDQLFVLNVSLPPRAPTAFNPQLDYRSFPNGTCGIDLYVLAYDTYAERQYLPIIERYAPTIISKSCTYSDPNKTSPWQLTPVSLGNCVVLRPQEELNRLPDSWRQGCAGIIILAHTDYLAAGVQHIWCNIPYMMKVDHSKYNLNATFAINGCPAGKYGGGCQNNCSCAVGVECHSFYGECMCPLGLQGTRCDQRKPELIVPKTRVYIPYGEEFTLICTAHGMSSPIALSWSKVGRDAPLQTTSHVDTTPYSPRPIVITSTIEAHNTSDNGIYWCDIVDGDGTPYRQSVSITVIAIPDPFIQVPRNHTALTGSNVTFACQVKRDAGTVRWVKGQNQLPSKAAEIKDGVGRYEILRPSEGVSRLRIVRAEFGDEAMYRCYAGHIFQAPDLAYAEAALEVQSDPYPECSFLDVIQTMAGQTVTLRCLVRQAKPVPTVTWSVQNGTATPKLLTTTFTVLSDDRRSWNVNTSATFAPVPGDDGKVVAISLVSPAWTGTREVTATLNVTYVPIVTITPDPITVSVGQDATIRCSARANPEPLSYSWTLQAPNQRPITNSSGSGTTYTFKNINKEYDMANLTCQVSNTIGKKEEKVFIKVTDNSISTGAKIGFSVSGGLCLVLLLLASLLSHRYRKEIKLWWARKAGKNKDLENKEFDVFISYKSSSQDEVFVIEDLIPRLEQDGYRVCVHYRFFLPGRSIIDNISDAVHRSRKTLLLLSPGFVESEWCCYEFQSALSQMLHLQADLIPVIFEDLGPPENLSPDLQTVLRTLSYVTWPGAVQGGRYQTAEDRERFWKLLWQALPSSPLGREDENEQLEMDLNPGRHAGMTIADDDSITGGDRVLLLHD